MSMNSISDFFSFGMMLWLYLYMSLYLYYASKHSINIFRKVIFPLRLTYRYSCLANVYALKLYFFTFIGHEHIYKNATAIKHFEEYKNVYLIF